ncbi:tetratricopeptide repeat protein [Myxococcus stipitatus]|uniref:tetratricopeptide repeat protein n=1 Tax=Myxococcus stipitatus TaxID=83455 RepID=UPI001F15FE8D|nr:tetratricopeptide repeat protein [Myxococcus stipitatus]MCE9671149.1 tetratricopeptide repeat protein [Myxococcus stipitatus]
MAAPRLMAVGVALAAVAAGGLVRWFAGASHEPPPHEGPAPLIRLEQAAREDDANAQARLAMAWMGEAKRTGESRFVERARLAARRALLVDPEQVEALKVELLILHQGHQFQALREAALGLTREHPHDAFFHGLLGDALMELGRYDEAAAAYQRMMDLKPSHATYTRVGYLRLLEGDVEGAISVLKLAASSADPMDDDTVARALCELGDAFLAQGSPDVAFDYFTVALSRRPGLDRAHVGRGHVLRARGDDAAAADEFRAAVAARPLATHHALLAEALEAQGLKAQAQVEYGRALASASREDDREHARLLLDLGRDAARAEQLARREHERRQDVFTQAVLAQALLAVGKVDEARAMARSAMRLGTPSARIAYVAGLVAAATGDPETARQQLTAALQGIPRLSPRQAARARNLLAAETAPRAGQPSP